MDNKYLYSFLKDVSFRSVCIFSVIVVVFCLVLIRLCLWQSLALKDIYDKQAIIAQIPALEAKIGPAKVLVNGVSLTLNGIISDKDQQLAVINNTLVKVGDTIDGKKVITITRYAVTLCNAGSVNKCIKLDLEQ